MTVDVSQKILIVGLGLLGGSYAKVLCRFEFHISTITLEQSSIGRFPCLGRESESLRETESQGYPAPAMASPAGPGGARIRYTKIEKVLR
jgi:hypothetical protein